jgi:hypothetical protein
MRLVVEERLGPAVMVTMGSRGEEDGVEDLV